MENELKNGFNQNKLEELLVAKWTEFLDSSKLLAFVLQKVHDNINLLNSISQNDIKLKGISITLSRFYLTNTGFNLWVEFHIPIAINKVAEGTMELNLSNKGTITYKDMLGNLICL